MTVLRHKSYVAEIDIDEEDGLFFGQVINTPGVITFYGKDIAELNAEFAKSSLSTKISAGSTVSMRASRRAAGSSCRCRQTSALGSRLPPRAPARA